MFDISWSELLILGIVTLIFVGPKELPRFLATLGKYAGVVRRQANEFRQYFDEAMREAELDRVRAELDAAREAMAKTVRDAERGAAAAGDAAQAPVALDGPKLAAAGSGEAEQTGTRPAEPLEAEAGQDDAPAEAEAAAEKAGR